MNNIKKISVLCAALAMGSSAYAAVPQEGSVIGNQATATYKDGSGATKTATSNLVETTVAKVSGVSIISDQEKTVSVGGTILFQHTVQNTGNGYDSYTLSASDLNSGNINFTNLVIYADSDQNGVPDSTTPINTTPNINSGASYGFIVSATIPNSATNADAESIRITATSISKATIKASNTDIVNVTGNAVIDVTKSLSVSSGKSPSTAPITVTLTYTNTGDSTATSVVLEDVLPVGFIYTENSGSWSGLATSLTDISDGDEGGIDYLITGNTVRATIPSIPSGSSGVLTFKVDVLPLVAPGNITNIAKISYNDGSGSIIGPVSTNGATYTVVQTAVVTISDEESLKDEDGSINDIVAITTPVSQGSAVLFDQKVVNNGNGSDTFELRIPAGHSFPVGTVFQFFKADGVTPLSDTNSDGNPDTGLILAGEGYKLVVKAILPQSFYGSVGYQFTTRATSKFNSSISDTVTNTLAVVTQSKVDLTNDIASSSGAGVADGLGDGVETAPVRTANLNPSETAEFVLVANNLSANQDNYKIEVSTDPTFATKTVPSGWAVTFYDDGNPTTSTSNIAGNDFRTLVAKVVVPSNALPQTTEVYFRVISELTGAFDIIHDRVVVNSVVNISLSPSNTGQIYPSGTATYSHVINNNGNTLVTAGTIVATNTQSGWNAVVYQDVNNDGAIDAGDKIVTNLSGITGGVPIGGSVSLLVKIFAISGATQGTVNTTTLTIGSVSGEINTDDNIVNDVSTVIVGDVKLEKKQAMDADCNGLIEGSFVTTPIANALPGNCVVYQIKATNTGSAIVNNLVINDATPAYTTYFDCAAGCSGSATTGTVTNPTSGVSGVVSVNVGDLAPTAISTLRFTVKIDE